MHRHLSARKRIAKAPLTAAGIASTLKATLPRRNNYAPINYAELLQELDHFGVRSRMQFRGLMLRHRRSVIAADRGPFEPRSVVAMRAELGDGVFSDYVRRQIFWTWEGLTREAMRLEFGERYAHYLRQRSGA